MTEGRRLRQALQPRRDPGAVLLREFGGLLDAAARRHRNHDFAGGGMNAQRVAARARVTAQTHLIDLAPEHDGDRHRLAGAAKE